MKHRFTADDYLIALGLVLLASCAALDKFFGGGPNTAPLHDEAVDTRSTAPMFSRPPPDAGHD